MQRLKLNKRANAAEDMGDVNTTGNEYTIAFESKPHCQSQSFLHLNIRL